MAITFSGWRSNYGIPTPELNISETIGGLLGKPRNSQGGSEIFGGQTLGATTQPIYKKIDQQKQSPYTPVPNQSYNIPNNRPQGSPQGNIQQNQGPQFPEMNIQSPSDPFGGGPSETDVINNEFNTFNSYLDQQENQSRSNFDETKGLYDTQKANAEAQYTKEKTTQTGDIKKTEALNLKRVRELLGDLSQGNAARIAISGGGSISEVMGERFGREAQSRLGNVMDSTQKAIERVNTFYDNSITKLNESYQANIMQAKQSLDENLSNIGLARTQSASAKQRATIDAWRGYYDQVNQAKLQAQNFKAQYDLWKDQQDNAYAATSGFSLGNADQHNQQTAKSFSDLPQTNAPQQATDQYNRNPYMKWNKNPQDDELENLQNFGVLPTGAAGGFRL